MASHRELSRTGFSSCQPSRAAEGPSEEVITQMLTGDIVGVPVYRTGRDLSAVAEAWIDDAADFGLLVMTGPDGNAYRVEPTNDSDERRAARRHHWYKLDNRPPLMRAVRAAVRRGYLAKAYRTPLLEGGQPHG